MLGFFDENIVVEGWFAPEVQPLGWFDSILLNTSSATPIGGYLVQPVVVDSIGGSGVLTINGVTAGSTILVQYSGTIDLDSASCSGSIAGAYTFINKSRNGYAKSVNQFYVYNHAGGNETITCVGINSSVVVAIYEIGGLDNSTDPLMDFGGAINTDPLTDSLTFADNAFLTTFWYNEGIDDYVSLVGVDTIAAHETGGNYNLQAYKELETSGTLSVGLDVGGTTDNVMVCAAWRIASGGGGGTSVSTNVGQLTFNGFAPTITSTNNQSVLSGLGALTFNGFAPIISLGINSQLGQLTLNGFAPNVNISVVASSQLGQLTVNGFSPTVSITNNQNVLSGVGALTLNGFAPVISLKINTDLGQLTLNGFAPSINISVVAISQTGQAILTGFAPSVVTTANITLNSGLGQLTLNGFAPTVAVSNNIRVSANLGQLTLNGLSPIVNISQSAVTSTGELLLSGYAPTVNATANQIINAGVGQLLVTGFEPSAVIGSSVVTSTGELILVGYEPSITFLANTFVYPSFGELLISGFRPRIRITTNTNFIQPDTINSSVINQGTLNSSVIGNSVNGISVIKLNPNSGDSVINQDSENISIIDI